MAPNLATNELRILAACVDDEELLQRVEVEDFQHPECAIVFRGLQAIQGQTEDLRTIVMPAFVTSDCEEEIRAFLRSKKDDEALTSGWVNKVGAQYRELIRTIMGWRVPGLNDWHYHLAVLRKWRKLRESERRAQRLKGEHGSRTLFGKPR